MLLSHEAGRERERERETKTDRDRRRAKGRTEKCVCRCFHSRFLSIVLDSSSMPWMKTFFAAHDVSVRLRTCCLVASSVVAACSLSLSLSLSREDEGTASCLYCPSLFHRAQGIIVLASNFFSVFMKMDCLVLLSELQTENSGGNRAFLLRRHRHSTKMRGSFVVTFPDKLLAGDRSLS